MPTQHMCDLETLSTRPDAIVLSIGVVAFDTDDWTIQGVYYAALAVDEQPGRHRSDSTLAWWAQQPEAARAVFHEPKVPVLEALTNLSSFMAGTQGVWGNGASFDNVILSSLFEDFGVERPWQFWHDRCFRTIKHIGNNHQVVKPPFEGVPHNALDDAVHQFQHLREIVKALNLQIN